MRSLNDSKIADHSIFLFPLGHFVLLTLSSVILWFSTNKLAKYLVPMDEEAEIPVVNLGLKEVQSLLFSTNGLVLLARSIPQLFQIIPEIIMIINNLLSGPAIDKSYFFIVQKILEFIIGFFLFLGSNGLVTILNKIRGNS